MNREEKWLAAPAQKHFMVDRDTCPSFNHNTHLFSHVFHVEWSQVAVYIYSALRSSSNNSILSAQRTSNQPKEIYFPFVVVAFVARPFRYSSFKLNIRSDASAQNIRCHCDDKMVVKKKKKTKHVKKWKISVCDTYRQETLHSTCSIVSKSNKKNHVAKHSEPQWMTKQFEWLIPGSNVLFHVQQRGTLDILEL